MGKKVCPETRVLIRFYRDQSEMSYRKISARCGVSKSTVFNLCNLKENCNSQGKKCDTRVGRPRALNERDERKLVRAFKRLRGTSVNFTIKDIIMESGLDRTKAKRRTVSNYFNKLVTSICRLERRVF